MKVLLSLSYNPTIDAVSGQHNGNDITTQRRLSDWGKTGISKYLLYLSEGIDLMRQARKFDVLVLCTVGMEAFVIGKLKRWLCPMTKIVCADFLMPRESKAIRLVRSWLNDVDGFVCIRRGDISVLERRFQISSQKCYFAHFPANEVSTQIEAHEDDYIYSAGIAHRDWPTLITVLAQLPYKAILSVDVPLQVPQYAQERVTVLPMQSPEEGRKLMAKAKVFVLCLEDTDLPSGPLVLLDAMAMGKPVIATHVNGTRDYINDGKDGILVAPKDSTMLASAVSQLMSDRTLRESIGRSAQETVTTQFTQKQFFDSINKVCEHVFTKG